MKQHGSLLDGESALATGSEVEHRLALATTRATGRA